MARKKKKELGYEIKDRVFFINKELELFKCVILDSKDGILSLKCINKRNGSDKTPVFIDMPKEETFIDKEFIN